MTHGVEGRSPASITTYLKGIDYPANRRMLIDKARSNGADDSLIDVISQLPDKEYGNMADVMECYSST